ncbi:MAG TPA: hypothetical protein VEB23_04670 [Ramlibacter sp.]|nr:hypothetical protein [Ramlibacter sp.]
MHLLSFAAPAFVVALLVGLAARLVVPAGSAGGRRWVPFLVNFAVGLAILGAGLWYFGRDGKMMTYAALVVGVATSQWVMGRAWRA